MVRYRTYDYCSDRSAAVRRGPGQGAINAVLILAGAQGLRAQ